jgi:aspartyl-tRNA(Asn)/glutamyl-tRNA(Gln) amidotransferase subunit A
VTSTYNETDLAGLSARQMLEGYASGRFSPIEVLDAVHERMDRLEPELNAFVYREDERARRRAAESARRWSAGEALDGFDGVPITIKENIAVAGQPLTAGTAAWSDAPAETVDGPVTMLTEAAGAVRLGTTTMPDYAMLSSGVSSLHGITRSPWNTGWTVGGSSSGAGAAGAARFGPLHIGTDIGGSVRLPATWTGLASLKPTYGGVPVDPPYLGRAVGPLARTVDDIALAMAVLSGPDPLERDHTWVPVLARLPWGDVWERPLQGAEIAGLRVAIHIDAGAGIPVDPEVERIVRDVATMFERAGAVVEPLPPFLSAEALGQLDLFLRARSWADVRALSFERRSQVSRYIQDWVLGGADLSGRQVLEAYHSVQALRARTAEATNPFDIVLSPVASVAAFPAEWTGPLNDASKALDHIAFTAPYNFSDQPAATVNAGFTEDGRPVGVQLAGRRFADVDVLRAASWFEANRSAGAAPTWPA